MKTKLLIVFLLSFLFFSQGYTQIYGWVKKVSVPGLGNPLAYNPLNENTIYGSGLSGTFGEINVSHDGGETWQLLSTLTGGLHVKSIVVNPNDTLTILVGQEADPSDRVMKTIDGGMTWTQTLTGDFSYFGVPLEFNPAHPDTVFTMMGSNLYRSIDFGSNWLAISNQSGYFNTWCDAALRPDSVNVMYVGDNTSGIWKTTDGGVTFRRVYRTTGEIPMIAIDQKNPAVAYATKFSGGGGFLKTTDYGETWTEISGFTGIDCWGVAVALHNSDLVVMGTYTGFIYTKGIYISTDQGSSWTRTTCGFATSISYNYGLLALDSSKVFALQSDGIYKFKVAFLENHPLSSISGIVKDSLTQSPIHANLKLSASVCDGSILYSTQTDSNGHFSFDSVYITKLPTVSTYRLEIDPQIPFSFLHFTDLYLDTNNIDLSVNLTIADVFLVGEDSANYATYYQTALESLRVRYNIWNTITKGSAPLERGNEFLKKIILYYTGNKHTALTQAELDGLVTCLNLGCNLFITGQDIVEKNDSSDLLMNYLGISYGGYTSIAYTAGFSGELFEGFGFFTTGTSANNQTSRDILTINNPQAKPILGYGASASGGTAAIRLDSAGAGGKVIFMGFGFEATNTAATRKAVMQRVIGYLDGSIVVGVDEDLLDDLPTQFRLDQNYPNPFNPITKLTFAISAPGLVSLKIYDILGRELAILVNERKAPGLYTTHWNASNLCSGVYFVRMIATSPEGRPLYTGTRKLLLTK